MNIEQAKTVPIFLLFDKINVKPARSSPHNCMYHAIWRNEKTASVHVDIKQNLWCDHGTTKKEGGTPIQLAQKILEWLGEPYTIKDALRWIANLSGNALYIKPIRHNEPEQPKRKLVIKNIRSVQHLALTQYLDSRFIPKSIGRKYLRELHLYNQNSKKYFFTLGFKNIEGGYELRNEVFKGNVDGKAITFIRGSDPDAKRIHLFEGWPDFLSIAADEKEEQLRYDSLVLNSLSLLKQATPYIEGYGYKIAYTWMDNDTAGKEATQSLAAFFKTEANLRHMPMNFLYKGHKDVNDWRIARLKAK